MAAIVQLCMTEALSSNLDQCADHKLNTQLNTKTTRKSIMHFKTAQNGKYWIFRVRVSVFTTYHFF